MKVTEKILPGQLESRRRWRGVLGIVPFGGAEGIRTPDLLRAREALSQLSYSPFYPAAAVLAVSPHQKWWAIEDSNL